MTFIEDWIVVQETKVYNVSECTAFNNGVPYKRVLSNFLPEKTTITMTCTRCGEQETCKESNVALADITLFANKHVARHTGE